MSEPDVRQVSRATSVSHTKEGRQTHAIMLSDSVTLYSIKRRLHRVLHLLMPIILLGAECSLLELQEPYHFPDACWYLQRWGHDFFVLQWLPHVSNCRRPSYTPRIFIYKKQINFFLFL